MGCIDVSLNNNVTITVIFLLYNAAPNVDRLVRSLLGQTHPKHNPPENWMKVLFVDDHSTDNTFEILQETLKKWGSPSHIQCIQNPENLGLSKNLNLIFKNLTTPFGLTCHCDCFFGRPDYIACMAELMNKHPEAGVITGQPQILQLPQSLNRTSSQPPLSLPDKINLVENLMDLFPIPIPEGATPEQWVYPVGFAEGRCDIFRKEAIEKAGYYDTTVRASGEDQLLCARMRQKGYVIYQAPALTYSLSVSDAQNSIEKLLRHHHLLARTSPYVLLKNRETLQGIAGSNAGANRKLRTWLRLHHLFSSGIYVGCLGLFLSGHFASSLFFLSFLVIIKLILFGRHLLKVQMTPQEILIFFALQILFDFIYTAGFAQGTLLAIQRIRQQQTAPSSSSGDVIS